MINRKERETDTYDGTTYNKNERLQYSHCYCYCLFAAVVDGVAVNVCMWLCGSESAVCVGCVVHACVCVGVLHPGVLSVSAHGGEQGLPLSSHFQLG